ncbi:MAG: PIN domain nuclease [Devosia nanyangense]|uniref:Ribonuclease VapC n=1 Tax=Devosia nanyangense TaxID=1228055 RepID=A0A933L0H9_9HYPH|nr:PIN domain nuclease [Devosia nanyangense]
MIVVDSSVWISHFANVLHFEVTSLRAIHKTETILIGDLIVLEVLRGARSERDASYIESELSLFDSAVMLNPDIASKAARNYRSLRAKGITIRNTVDLIVGTYCIEHRHRLLHRDRDFAHMEQLGLETYTG